MTLKRRVKKLETGGTGSSGLEGLPEQLMELDTESVDLWHKLDAMTEPELIQFAFDAEGSTERKEALQRLKAAGIEKTRVKDGLLELLQASAAYWRRQAYVHTGRTRNLCGSLARMDEDECERIKNEKT